jgi:hypothetical protein
VQSQYGQGVDGERYLRKFFDLEYHLPEPSAEQVALRFFREVGLLPDDAVFRQIRESLRHGQTGGALSKDVDAVECFEAFVNFAPRLGLHLRDCAQALTMLAAVLRSVPDDVQLLPVPLTLGILLRFALPVEFENIVRPGGSLSALLVTERPEVVLSGSSRRHPLRALSGTEHQLIRGGLFFLVELGSLSGSDRRARVTQNLHAAIAQPEYNQPARRRYDEVPIAVSIDEHLRTLLISAGAFFPTG